MAAELGCDANLLEARVGSVGVPPAHHARQLHLRTPPFVWAPSGENQANLVLRFCFAWAPSEQNQVNLVPSLSFAYRVLTEFLKAPLRFSPWVIPRPN